MSTFIWPSVVDLGDFIGTVVTLEWRFYNKWVTDCPSNGEAMYVDYIQVKGSSDSDPVAGNITSVSDSPDPVTAGQQIGFDVDVENTGIVTWEKWRITIDIYEQYTTSPVLDSPEVIDGSDIAPGDTDSRTLYYTIPDSWEDGYQYSVTVDVYYNGSWHQIDYEEYYYFHVDGIQTVSLDDINLSPSHPRMYEGQSFTVRYYISNPTGTDQTVYLLARSRTPGGAYNLLQDSNGQQAVQKAITPGSDWYERDALIYSGAPVADGYSLTWFVSETTNWSDFIDSREDNDAFDVIEPPNTPPTLDLTAPAADVTVEPGDTVLIQWTDSDPDDNAVISLARDTDNNPQNDSGHAWIVGGLSEDPDGSGDQYTWDTTDVPPGQYYIWGKITDTINPEVYDLTSGMVTVADPNAIEIPAYWGLGNDLGSYSVFGSDFTIRSYLNRSKIIVTEYVGSETVILADEVKNSAILRYHAYLTEGPNLGIESPSTLLAEGQEKHEAYEAYSLAAQGKIDDLNEAKKAIVGKVLTKSLLKFGILAAGVFVGAFFAASIATGPPGWVVGAVGAIVLTLGAATIAFGASSDILHVQATVAGDEFLMAEHFEYINSIAYLEGEEAADKEIQEFLSAPILAEQWENGSATFANLEMLSDTAGSVAGVVTIHSLPELILAESELAVGLVIEHPLDQHLEFQMEQEAMQALMENSYRTHFTVLSALAEDSEKTYQSLGEQYGEIDGADTYGRNLFRLALAEKLYLANENEIAYSVYRRADACAAAGTKKCKFEYTDEELDELFMLWKTRHDIYVNYLDKLEYTGSYLDDLTNAANSAYSELGLEQQNFSDLIVGNEQIPVNASVAAESIVEIRVSNVGDSQVSNIRIQIAQNDDSGIGINNCEYSSLNPGDSITANCTVVIPNQMDINSSIATSLVDVHYRVGGIDRVKSTQIMFGLDAPYGIAEIKAELSFPAPNSSLKIDATAFSKKSTNLTIVPRIEFQDSYSQQLNPISVTIQANQAESFSVNWIVPGSEEPRGTYSIHFEVFETNGPRLNYSFSTAAYLIPHVVGDISRFDSSNAAIVSPNADDDISRRLQNAFDIPENRFLILEDLTVGELLPIMQRNDIILVGGNQANELVQNLIDHGKLPNDLWTQTGDATIHVVEDPFTPLVPAGNYAVVVAGYELEDTYTAGFGLIRANEIQNEYQSDIDVRGNNNSIDNGNNSPSPGDGTDFGDADVTNGSVQKSFSIHNVGNADLNLSGSPKVSVTGAHAADFSVSQQPSSPISAGGSTTFNITFNPSAASERTATVSIDSNDPDEDPFTFAIEGNGTVVTEPDIDVKGNNISIDDGDNSPSPDDGTDFGNADVTNGSVQRTFTIHNVGNADLNLSGSPKVSVSGTHAADFSVSQQPSSPVSAGGSTTFNIIFNPSAASERTATVSIDSNDPDEDPFTFAIKGNGTIVTEPDIDVRGNSNSIDNGDNTPSPSDGTDFGDADVTYGSVQRTFSIHNTGSANLNMTGSPKVAISGAHAADFSVSEQPSSLVSAGGSTAFEITFNPSAANERTATISIDSNDPDEDPFTFAIKGNGTTVTEPDIDVRGNNTSIDNGDNSPSPGDGTDFGSADVTYGSIYRTFWVENVGNADLNLIGSPKVVVSGAQAADFSVSQQPTSPVTSGGSTNFQVIFNPSAAGERTATITIANNDPDEDPFTFAIKGNGSIVTDPDIDVRGNNTSINDGDNTPSPGDGTDFDNADVTNGSVQRTFSIHNTGNANLNLIGSPMVYITGPHAADFSVTQQPSSPVTENNSTDFKITFNPSVVGERTATVIIGNNDPDENPYNFAIKGNGSIVTDPDIDVRGNNTSINDGDNTPSPGDGTDFGDAEVSNDSVQRTFAIHNVGNANLNLSGSPEVSVSGAHAPDFSVNQQPSSPVSAGGSTSFAITFNPSAAGNRTATVSIDSNDPDEDPFTFAIKGNGTIVTEPDIDVRGNNTSIGNGDNSPSPGDGTDFGNADVTYGSIYRTFWVNNVGNADLNLNGSPKVSVSGAEATDFSVSQQPTSPVLPGGSTNFQVIFNPSAAGERTATITIANSDPDEDPFTFAIKGNGTDTVDSYEPNDILGEASPITYGDIVSGANISPTGDLDFFRFDGLAGDPIIANVDAQSIGSTLDSWLFLYDASGVLLDDNDDESLDNFDSYLEFTLPADGTYFLMVREYRHGNEGGADYFYDLSLNIDRPCGPGTLTLEPTADSYTNSLYSDKNYGDSTSLRVKDAVTDMKSYLQFEVSGTNGTQIESAELRLFIADTSKDLGRVYLVDNGWAEDTITWNNAPENGCLVDASGEVDGKWVEFDVSATISGDGPISFALESRSSDLVRYNSKEGTNPPQLVISYNVPGTGPVDADFLFEPEEPYAGQPVQFTDTSTGCPSNWDWDFGNGDKSTEQNPIYEYPGDGTFTVTMKASNINNSGTKSKPIVVQPVPPGEEFYVSSSSNGNAGDVRFKDEDILFYDTTMGEWSMYLDGSDVGLGSSASQDIDAFHLLDDDSILISFLGAAKVRDVGKVDDSDIVRFTPTSTGDVSSGSFELYFDGSDVELSTSGEDVDAITMLDDGDLVISTSGNWKVSGMSGKDEDLLRFSPSASSTGEDTRGSWSLYFDGSDVGLSNSTYEEIWGAWYDVSEGDLYLTTYNKFSVTGAKGDGADVLHCGAFLPGDNTDCTFELYWDGSLYDFAREKMDGLSIKR